MSLTPFHEGSVRGFLHRPVNRPRAGLMLTHGAGANCGSLLLVAVAAAFCQEDFLVLRCDLPFRQRRPFGPPAAADAATDQANLREAAAVLRDMAAGPVLLGGHSYGGRQASLLAAVDEQVADALLLLSYPLHPPGKPDQLRTAHWPTLRTRALFLHGTRDAFGSTEELRAALPLIPAATALRTVPGAGHELLRGKFDVREFAVEPLCALVNRG